MNADGIELIDFPFSLCSINLLWFWNCIYSDCFTTSEIKNRFEKIDCKVCGAAMASSVICEMLSKLKSIIERKLLWLVQLSIVITISTRCYIVVNRLTHKRFSFSLQLDYDYYIIRRNTLMLLQQCYPRNTREIYEMSSDWLMISSPLAYHTRTARFYTTCGDMGGGVLVHMQHTTLPATDDIPFARSRLCYSRDYFARALSISVQLYRVYTGLRCFNSIHIFSRTDVRDKHRIKNGFWCVFVARCSMFVVCVRDDVENHVPGHTQIWHQKWFWSSWFKM